MANESDTVPSPGDPDLADAVAALRALMLATQEFRQAIATKLGLNITDTLAMSYLSADGPLTAGELAERTGLTASSVTALLDRLETAELITRRRSAEDRRTVTAVITDVGLHTLGWARQWMEAALRDLETDDLGASTRILRSLAESLRESIHSIAK